MQQKKFRELRDNRLNDLSEFAARNPEYLHREHPEDNGDGLRSPFERDSHQLLFSLPFRRLRHKTQVFFLPENDHICTRLEHALYVQSIADTIARYLHLDTDLTAAIAFGHDLGHAPFGHHGEKVLSDHADKRAWLKRFFHEE